MKVGDQMAMKRNRCPSDTDCNGELHRKRIDYTFESNGKKIQLPDLEVWQCDRCNELFFPAESNERIDLYRLFSGRLLVRIPPELHCRLTQVAKAHHRSLNQEITSLLSQALGESVH